MLLKLLALLVRTGYSYSLPIGYSSKTVERYLAQHELDEELAAAIRKFAVMLRQSGDNDAKRTATRLEQLSSPFQEEPASGAPLPLKPAPTPATAGDPHVLSPLKHLLGMLSADITVDTVTTGPDRYAMSRESPLTDEHAKLASLLEEKIQAAKWNTDLETFKVGKEILGRDDVARGRLLVAAVERHMASLLGPAIDYSEPTYWKAHSGLGWHCARAWKRSGCTRPIDAVRRHSLSRNEAILCVATRRQAVGIVGYFSVQFGGQANIRW